jgi:hypothetical protein
MIDQQSTWMDSPLTLRVAKVTRRQRTIHDIFANFRIAANANCMMTVLVVV